VSTRVCQRSWPRTTGPRTTWSSTMGGSPVTTVRRSETGACHASAHMHAWCHTPPLIALPSVLSWALVHGSSHTLAHTDRSHSVCTPVTHESWLLLAWHQCSKHAHVCTCSQYHLCVCVCVHARALPNTSPMYGNHNGLLVMAGDRPFARYGADESVHGQLTLGYHRAATNTTVWFHTLETGYTAQYRGGEVRWIVRPVPNTSAVVTWTVLPLDSDIGMVSEITSTGASTGDRLLFMFGGAYKLSGKLKKISDVHESDNAACFPVVARHTTPQLF
jgi:hypothetical protein